MYYYGPIWFLCSWSRAIQEHAFLLWIFFYCKLFIALTNTGNEHLVVFHKSHCSWIGVWGCVVWVHDCVVCVHGCVVCVHGCAVHGYVGTFLTVAYSMSSQGLVLFPPQELALVYNECTKDSKERYSDQLYCLYKEVWIVEMQWSLILLMVWDWASEHL